MTCYFSAFIVFLSDKKRIYSLELNMSHVGLRQWSSGQRIGLRVVHAGNVGSFPRHFIILASSVDRGVNSGPVGRKWPSQRFQTLNLSCTFFTFRGWYLLPLVTTKVWWSMSSIAIRMGESWHPTSRKNWGRGGHHHGKNGLGCLRLLAWVGMWRAGGELRSLFVIFLIKSN